MSYRHFRADDAERRKWQDPEAILAEIGVKPGDTFVDIGCGGGFFTLPAARAVGKNGKVYGVDISAGLIEELKALASREGLNNLELVVGRAEDTVFCQSCADTVFFGIVLHDFDEPGRVLDKSRKMLKPTGRLVNLDWKNVAMPIGPPLWRRFSQEKAAGLMEAAGLTVISIKDAGTSHYMIVATL